MFLRKLLQISNYFTFAKGSGATLTLVFENYGKLNYY